MPFLVQTITGNVETRLKQAYLALSRRYLAQLGAAESDEDAATEPKDWEEARERVVRAGSSIEITEQDRLVSSDLSVSSWKPVEVINGLNHIAALIAAVECLRERGWEIHGCMPTQQYADDTSDEDADAARQRKPDLWGLDPNGASFALEAYGGVRYRNNSKLALDLAALEREQGGGARTLLAAQTSAWPVVRVGKKLTATCAKRHGDFSRECVTKAIFESGDYQILEVEQIVP
ncbi:MAG: hypothetical protein R3F05_01855 [Planctomycetota bacterium]